MLPERLTTTKSMHVRTIWPRFLTQEVGPELAPVAVRAAHNFGKMSGAFGVLTSMDMR